MDENENLPAVVSESSLTTYTANDVLKQVALIQEVMGKVMHDGEHYGKIPGCGNKPTLLQPGAQKLTLTFRMAPKLIIEKRDLPNSHREYEIVCELYHIGTGNFLGAGTGMCSSMESKYRFRNAARICPECGRETIIKGKAEYGGGWLCFAKKGGCGAKWEDGAPEIEDQETGKIENENPADQFNTVKKMAAKRALVAAVLTATAASDLFTQDIEELVDNGVMTPTSEPPPKENKTKTDRAATDNTLSFKKWMDTMAAEKDRIGTANYYMILHKSGFEHANEVKERKVRTEIYKEMQTMYPPEQAKIGE